MRSIRRPRSVAGRPPRMDAGGAQMRQQQTNIALAKRVREFAQGAFADLSASMTRQRTSVPTREQLIVRLGLRPIPEISTVNEVYKLHETITPEAPVYRVNRELLDEIGIAGVLRSTPNIEKVGVNEALGAHFDEYRHIGASWTTWTSIVGSGVLHACFLDDQSFAEFQEMSAERQNPFDDHMQRVRVELGNKCLNATVPKYMTKYAKGDTFVLWHGSLEDLAANPGVHQFDRSGEGVYSIHAAAHNLGAELPAGFTRLS